MHPSGLLPRAVSRAVVSSLALAIAGLLTAGTPIALRHAAREAVSDAPAAPSARNGIDVVIADRPAAGTTSARAVTTSTVGSAATTTVQESRGAPFTIVLPEGWSGGELTDFEDDARRSFRYEDGTGRYFVVNLDPFGAGFEADEVWRYRIAGDGFAVASERRCVPGEAMCALGDGEQTIYAIWEDGGSARAGAHRWYFRFGDAGNEIGGTRIFREILESIRVAP